eukprot:CAMPEP_0115336594 /NCGR_PEP_ID=MMETSP0270-20121206/89087_1 /TAXON_ID=71861 /ORGANISM="Scrippsiella trochoidea, Strain CCMP3099" /LENGTH=100 /DNA_ID=CAMNT_0002757773 /DNA_START=541 /DNA_END=843 /DNA_ORIENTATION=-
MTETLTVEDMFTWRVHSKFRWAAWCQTNATFANIVSHIQGFANLCQNLTNTTVLLQTMLFARFPCRGKHGSQACVAQPSRALNFNSRPRLNRIASGQFYA